MSSSRAMASAQQKRVTMQKSIAPANNSNPRRSIASRGRFNVNPKKNQMLQPQQQMVQQQPPMVQQQPPMVQQQQQQMFPQQPLMVPQQQQMIPQQNDQFLQMQNNFASNSKSNYDYSPMPFQSPSPVKSNKKIHINQVVSILSQKIANVERIMFGDNDTEMKLSFAKKNNNEIDNSVLTIIIERIEKLENSVLMFDNLKELIDSNTKAIEELQRENDKDYDDSEDDVTNEDDIINEDDVTNEDANDENINVQTNTQNVNLIVEDVSDSEEDTYHSNYFERNRLFMKPTF